MPDSQTQPRLPTRYQVRDALGAGGMGVVYRALDTASGQEVAIKLLPAGANEQMLQRLRQEADTQAALQHPNVVSLLEASSYEGQEYMVMELIAGGNLYTFLSGKPSLHDILEAFCGLCDGLDYIHSQGLVHRDLKPENMLFTPEGHLKIADLGVVRRVDSDSRLTRSGVIVGTCEYVAPEQILTSNVTSSADLYSLGVTLFEALTGQTPFVGDSEFVLLQAHLREKPPAVRSLQPEVPPSLEVLVGRLLEKQPDNRPRSAAQVRDALKACIEELGQDADSPDEDSEEHPVAHDVSTLLVGLSQEIWNPMNGIIGMTRLLKGTPMSESQHQYCQAVESSALALQRVFANILDFTRLEAGMLRLDPVPMDVRSLVQQVVESRMPQAEEKSLGLYSQVDVSVPDTVICDPLRLRQVLNSLIANALKYTSQGLVSVAVQREHDEPGKVGLRIAVADTGVGMTEAQLRTLFMPSMKRSRPGAGLGLTVTRGLVQAMGGRIWAESLPGRGTTFTVALRLPLGGAALAAVPDKPNRSLRILLAEDQPVNQTLAIVLLQLHKHEVTAVSNGREVLEKLEQDDFDAILMDLQMPEMDGLEATRLIRQSESESGSRRIPIIALTALDNDHSEELGFDAHVPKPLEEKELLRALARVVKDAPVPQLIKAEEPAYDERALLGRVGGSTKHARTLVEVFLDVCPQQTEAIDTAFRAVDAAALEEAVRNLRTSLEGVAAGPAARIAGEIEQMTREGRLDAALHARRSLLIEIERLLDILTDS